MDILKMFCAQLNLTVDPYPEPAVNLFVQICKRCALVLQVQVVTARPIFSPTIYNLFIFRSNQIEAKLDYLIDLISSKKN